MAGEMRRWEPGRELSALRDDMERFFRQTFGGTIDEQEMAGAWAPAVDVEEGDDAFVVHAEMPGVDPKDIDVRLDEGTLTVSGERRFYQDRSEEGFRRVERRFGSFRRAVRLPSKVDPAAVEATYRDGVLTVKVPKAAEAQPHRIEVRTEVRTEG